MNERIDLMERGNPREPPREGQQRRAPVEVFDEFVDANRGDDFDHVSVGSRRRDGDDRGRRDHGQGDRDLGGIKMKIPEFRGKGDSKEYLDWERKIELVFDCHQYSEQKKVKLETIEFTEYAIVWWDKLCIDRR